MPSVHACRAAFPAIRRFALALSMICGSAAASPLKSDEEVVFFPTAAHPDSEGNHWILPVHAWIFEPERGSLLRRGALAGAAAALDLDESAAGSDIFRERAAWFLVDNERGKRIDLDVATSAAGARGLGPSGPDGHLTATLMLERNEAGPGTAPVRLDYALIAPPGDVRRFRGQAFLIPANGLSVISDIDDTVKISQVTDKLALLENSFLRPFAAAPGMAELYQGLARRGAAFHYVSSSPWQLYPSLADFQAAAGLPGGSIHLRSFRFKDETFLNLFKSSQDTKPPVIEALLAAWPARGFVLIGDSGEADPEIYAAIARSHPGQVRAILIRNVTGEAAGDRRFQEAFQGLPADLWQLFADTDAAEAFLDRRLDKAP